MKVTKNKDSLFNIEGLSEKDSFMLLFSCSAMQYGLIDSNLYYGLLQVLGFNPDSFFVNYYSKIKGKIKEQNNCLGLEYFREVERIYNEEYSQPVVKTKVNTRENYKKQKRDAKGRFIAKRWIASFTYIKSWSEQEDRVVSTNLKQKDIKYLTPKSSIEGIDLNKNAFRRFSIFKIKDGLLGIKWEYRYPQ